MVTGPRDLRGGSEAMGQGWGQGGDRWRDLEGGGTCRWIPSPPHGASLRDRISPTGTARCARAPSPRLGSGRRARVRGAAEPSGCVNAQSQGRRARLAGTQCRREGGARAGVRANSPRGASYIRQSRRPSGGPSVRPEPVRPELCAARGGAEAWRGGPEPAPGPFPCLRLRGGILAGKG